MKMRFFLALAVFATACALPPWLDGRNSATNTAAPTISPIRSTVPPTLEPTPTQTPTSNESVLRREEYAIYAAVVRSVFAGGRIRCIVLREYTTARHLTDGEERTLEYLQAEIPEISEDWWADFLAINREPFPLTPPFDFDLPVILISDEEIAALFTAEGDGWEEFYKTYPGAQGILEFSRAAFTPEMDRALVYSGNQSDYLAGIGNLYLMKKTEGEWRIDKFEMVWIS